eukprot:scaffold125122_cov63-Phaeocystis_antarctica.AAC.4
MEPGPCVILEKLAWRSSAAAGIEESRCGVAQPSTISEGHALSVTRWKLIGASPGRRRWRAKCSALVTRVLSPPITRNTILMSVFWRERLSCQSVPLGVAVRLCILSEKVEMRSFGELEVCRTKPVWFIVSESCQGVEVRLCILSEMRSFERVTKTSNPSNSTVA